MPIKQIFEKVFIKSESDLPKENGEYITHDKIIDIVRLYSYRKPFKNEYKVSGGNKPIWIETINWYLQPIEQPAEKEEPSDEDIKNASIDYWQELDTRLLRGASKNIMDAYKQGVKDYRDNNIYISNSQESQSSPAEKVTYTLNCTNCEKTFYSEDVFLKPQLCHNCFILKNKSMVDEALELASKKCGKSDPHNDIYGPGLDNYGRDKFLYGPEPAKQLMKDKFKQSSPAMSLKPQEEITDIKKQPEVTGFEIADSIEDIFKNTQRVHGENDHLNWIRIASIRSMRFIASLKKEITDEMIEKQANLHFEENSSDNAIWKGGAKWLRSQMTVNRREELKPTDEDINFFAAAYGELTEGNKHGELTFAYRKGAMDMRDNKIYLTSLNQKEK